MPKLFSTKQRRIVSQSLLVKLMVIKLLITFIMLVVLAGCVIYFDQRLGAVHSRPWSKFAVLLFFVQKIKLMHTMVNVVENYSKP